MDGHYLPVDEPHGRTFSKKLQVIIRKLTAAIINVHTSLSSYEVILKIKDVRSFCCLNLEEARYHFMPTLYVFFFLRVNYINISQFHSVWFLFSAAVAICCCYFQALQSRKTFKGIRTTNGGCREIAFRQMILQHASDSSVRFF